MRRAPTRSARCRWASTRSSRSSTAGLTTFRRRGVEIAMDGKAQLDITLDAASAAAAAEGERQELLQRIATLEKRVGDLGIERGAVRAGDARPARRGLRRPERTGARRAGARREAGGDLPARARLPPPDDQREDRRGAGGCGEAQRDRRRRCRHGDAVCRRAPRATSSPPTSAPMRWRRRTCSSPPASRRTRCSSPTSSA